MKVFISHPKENTDFAKKLAAALRKKKFETWVDVSDLKIGDNIFETISQRIKDSDFIIVVLSKAFARAKGVHAELSAYLTKEVATKRNTILPVLIEDCEIPVMLRDRFYADFRGSFEVGLDALVNTLSHEKRRTPTTREKAAAIKENTESSIELQLEKIRNEYSNGNLSIFCGAGVSLDAGLPSWSVLLESLLRRAFSTEKTLSTNLDPELQASLAKLYQKSLNLSPLMIAQYLKNMLGKDFLRSLRDELYPQTPRPSKLIAAIVDLCRPRRSRNCLRSIITFNFDDLIEQALSKDKIKHKAIFHEGQRCGATELPIYHVHGFLPQSGTITSDNEVVFSEDAYHSQFIDSFSWANLVQLNHLNQNSCVFIGLSMTDPNLRRLLDVSMRKNPDRVLNHYVVKRKYVVAEMRAQLEKLGVKDSEDYFSEEFVKITETLEQQDAKNLGLNAIWIDDYAEVPGILGRLVVD